MVTKVLKRKRIHFRIRKKVVGSATKPRLGVFRSNKGIYVQAFDDLNGVTIASACHKDVASGNKSAVATEVGKAIGAKLIANGITEAVFDRSGYLYHGRVKALADGARESGLVF